METEPTAEKRQALAFDFLREQARNAHIAGDGLLVSLLCHTGLQRLDELLKEKKLLLPFAEIAWMPIFGLYWLVDPTERYVIERSLKELKSKISEANDLLAWEWVERYRVLIEQPLAGDAGLPLVNNFAWPDFFVHRTPEGETLLSHMVELAWFQGPHEKPWIELVNVWSQTSPAWFQKNLKTIVARLDWQTRLTCPKLSHEIIPESNAAKLREYNEIAELWLLNLHGRSRAVCEAAERLTPKLSSESHRWRILHDFLHFETFYESHEDNQNVRLARRRRLSAETPLLIFNDKREEELVSALGKLFRQRSVGGASSRWDVFMLARLHEMAALRVWDFGAWIEANRAQSQANMELAQWPDADPGRTAQGLVQAVRSFTSISPDKDAFVRRAIDMLEFAPADVLVWFCHGLLATYPRQKHRVLVLLEDTADLFVSETWAGLARWTVSYMHESVERRTDGWASDAAAHWNWLLPVVPPESPVWATLQPEVLRMAGGTLYWHGRSVDFLQRWLLLAPLPLAREMAETMVAHPPGVAGERYIRAAFMINFEKWNPHLHGMYTRRLLPDNRSSSDFLILARHLDESGLAATEEDLRQQAAGQVARLIAKATPPPEITSFELLHFTAIENVDSWRVEEQPLLEALIAAVNSPNLIAEYLIQLLQIIRLMVADGPSEFAETAKPHVAEWTQVLPQGRVVTPIGGPLSVIHITGGGQGSVALMVGELAFQLAGKLGERSSPVALAWARKMLLMEGSKPLYTVVGGCAEIALNTADSAEPLSLMETAMVSLRSRAGHDTEAMQSLANALRRLASIVETRLSSASARESAASSVDSFVAVLSRLIPHFAQSPNAPLRSAVAALVWQLKERGRSERWIALGLQGFQQDRRARVRFEASGGWEVARARSIDRSKHNAAENVQ